MQPVLNATHVRLVHALNWRLTDVTHTHTGKKNVTNVCVRNDNARGTWPRVKKKQGRMLRLLRVFKPGHIGRPIAAELKRNVHTANTRQKNHRPIPSKCSHRMKSFAWKFTWWITIWYWMYSQWTIRSADYFNTIQFYGLMNGIIWWLKYHIKQCWVGILVVDSWHHIEYSEEGRGLGETHKASIYVRSMNNNCN